MDLTETSIDEEESGPTHEENKHEVVYLEAQELGEEEQVPVMKVEEVEQEEETSDIEDELKNAPDVDELPQPTLSNNSVDDDVCMMKVTEVAQ